MSAAKKKKNKKSAKKKQNAKMQKKKLEANVEEKVKEESNEKVKEDNESVKDSKENNKNKKASKKQKDSAQKKESTAKEEKNNKTSKKKKDEVQEDENTLKEEPKSKKKSKKNKEKAEKEVKEKDQEKQDEENAIQEENKVEAGTEEKNSDKPEYVKKMIMKKKIKTYIFIISAILVVLIIAFSTLFALFNMNNENIINGVSLKGIDISNLSEEDAKNKVNEAINKELVPEIILKYGEYEKSMNAEQIEYKYKVEEAVKNAYEIGRSGNILKNNYALIFSNLFGKKAPIDYTYNEELLNQFIDTASVEIPGVVIEPSYYIEDSKLIISKGTDGVKVKKDELKEKILDGLFERKYEEITDEYKQEIEIPVENAKASEIDLDKIYSEIHTEPRDAYFEANPYKIYPDVDGVDLAMSLEEAKNILNSEEKQEYSLDLNITKASKTINDLGTEAFPYLVSSFSTRYDASNTNRSTNLAIAANKINGKVLMPGEEFSYNQVVGKRTVEEGYRDAAIYQDGKVVDGLAGGICQISSTLYNAVLLANLEVTERTNHSYTTSYVAAGRDATVVWGTKDFKFKNSRSYPIKIEASVRNGIAEFKIHGVQEEKEYEIRILPVTTGSIPYSTSYIQDPTLAPGQQIVSQAGHAGYRVTTYKEVRYNGEVISKDVITNDTYKPMQTVIRVGPGVPAQ